VPYSEYPQFQQLQAEGATRVFDARLIDQIIQLVEGLVAQPKKGTSVLDVWCGQGHAINLMAKAFPRSKFAGFDISKEGVEAARREARQRQMGLINAQHLN
jgi:trans-aconitate methyltransferase